jgi:hypothetical protein
MMTLAFPPRPRRRPDPVAEAIARRLVELDRDLAEAVYAAMWDSDLLDDLGNALSDLVAGPSNAGPDGPLTAAVRRIFADEEDDR